MRAHCSSDWPLPPITKLFFSLRCFCNSMISRHLISLVCLFVGVRMPAEIVVAITNPIIWELLRRQEAFTEVTLRISDFNAYDSLVQNNPDITGLLLLRSRMLLAADIQITSDKKVLDDTEVVRKMRDESKTVCARLDGYLGLYGLAIVTREGGNTLTVPKPNLYTIKFMQNNQGKRWYGVFTTDQLQGTPRPMAASSSSSSSAAAAAASDSLVAMSDGMHVGMDELLSPSYARDATHAALVSAKRMDAATASSSSSSSSSRRLKSEPSSSSASTSNTQVATTATPPTANGDREERERDEIHRQIIRYLGLTPDSNVLLETIVIVEHPPEIDGTLAGPLRSVFFENALKNSLVTTSRTVASRLSHPAVLSVDTVPSAVETARLGPYSELNDVNALQSQLSASAGARARQQVEEMKRIEQHSAAEQARRQDALIRRGSKSIRAAGTGRMELSTLQPWETTVQSLPTGRTAIPAPKPELPTEMLNNVTLQLANAAGMLFGVPASIGGSIVNPQHVNETVMFTVMQVIGERRGIFQMALRQMYKSVFASMMMERFLRSNGTVRELDAADRATRLEITFTATSDPLNSDRLLDMGAIDAETFAQCASAYSGIPSERFDLKSLTTRRNARARLVELEVELVELQLRQGHQALRAAAELTAAAKEDRLAGNNKDGASAVGGGGPKAKPPAAAAAAAAPKPAAAAAAAKKPTPASSRPTTRSTGAGKPQSTATGQAATVSSFKTTIPKGAYKLGAGPPNRPGVASATIKDRGTRASKAK